MRRDELRISDVVRHPGHLNQVYGVWDLVALSVSSVGPLFSIAATGGVMAALAGWWTLPAIGLLATPFIASAYIFRLLNRHFPHSGASYHWTLRVVGPWLSRYQAWIVIVAYFVSIPPIVIPAASYTIALVDPHAAASGPLEIAVSAAWVLFALVPLLGGAKPTARITQAFLAFELISVVVLATLGVANYSRLHVPIHFGPPPIRGIVVVIVIAATILDGWEIDSYASEEASRPKRDPGKGGIVGAFMALGFYAILYPLMLGETPMAKLAGATNPLAVWGTRLDPHAPWLILLPVLGSTAGGLWLTSFILIRALYAMGREGLVPSFFARTNSRKVPHFATILTLGAALLVTALQVLSPSINSFFGLVLSAAGFFLVAEFLLDSITSTVFLIRQHAKAELDSVVHSHHGLLVASIGTNLIYTGLIILFLLFGPGAIGGSIDIVVGVLLAAGVVFALLRGRSHKDVFVFAGEDSVASGLSNDEIAS
ncbi:MAG: APC family permease [Ferrimicrobium sp.]